MSILLVLTTLPDQGSADRLARLLIDRELAACVNILPPIRSVYRWQGQIQEAVEVPLQIKTTPAAYPALEQTLLAQHPYTTPEIIALPVQQGSADYIEWVQQATRQTLATATQINSASTQ